jgi:hypothetical protein
VNSVALIVIYNHQYNDNIDVVEKIYSDRFSNIFHLVPFYAGVKKNVIPVYENSYYFQGYVAQSLKIIFEIGFTHYFFIADDLILNPSITEQNYTEHLGLDDDSSFLPGFIQLHERSIWWARVGEAYKWNLKAAGVEADGLIPSYDEALNAFNKFGLSISPLRFNQIWLFPKTLRSLARTLLRDKTYFIRLLFYWWKKFNLSYPLVGSYSDIFVINSKAIKDFAHYCGVFAATRLHAEVTIPTAMILSTQKIVTEEDLELKGVAIWTTSDQQKIEKQFNFQLLKLLSNFPSKNLYLHPIKLSRWKMTK